MRNKMLLWSFLLALMMVPRVSAQNQKGYKGTVNAGWIFLSAPKSFEALTIHGYQFNPYLFLGAGAGVNYYLTNSGDDAGFIPIFVDVRGYLLNKPITPYAEAKIGGQLTYNGNGENGIYFAPELGCKFSLSRKVGLDLGVEYILQKSQNIIGAPDANRTHYIDTGGLCVKVGVEF